MIWYHDMLLDVLRLFLPQVGQRVESHIIDHVEPGLFIKDSIADSIEDEV